MSSYVLKIIGIISMLIDHIGFAFGNQFVLRLIGRISFPIFAFQAVIGYEHTKSRKKHLLKLLIFALISQLPYYLFCSIGSNELSLNVMFTMLLGLLTIEMYKRLDNKLDKIIAVVLMCYLALVLNVDYQWLGVLIIFLFYYYKDNIIKAFIAFMIFFTIYYSFNLLLSKSILELYYLLGTLLALVPIYLYNNTEGRKTKYLFYIFYPAHLLVIYFIHLIIKG